ncbi:MAG: hypothetical protein GX557_15410 [Chloroflexi bacterium]|nr:hypothetical protein [Chloroflexota bacterium]
MSTQPTISAAGAFGRLLVLVLLLALLFAVTLAGLGVLLYQGQYATRIYRGVHVLGVHVGGLTRDEARDVLASEWVDGGLPYVELSTTDQRWVVSTQTLGGRLDVDGAVEQAWQIGRSGVFRRDLVTQVRLFLQPYQVVPELSIDPGPMLVGLRRIARQASHPARSAQLQVGGLEARTDASQTGRELDLDATRDTIVAAVQQALGETGWLAPLARREQMNGLRRAPQALFPLPLEVAVAFRELQPALTEVAGARERVQAILQGPVTLVATLPETDADGRAYTSERRWSIDQAVLESWLVLRPVQGDGQNTVQVNIDEHAVSEYVRALAPQLERPPRETRFDYDPKTRELTTLAPGQDGYALNLPAAEAAVLNACYAAEREVALPITVIKPRVTRAELETLLPLTLVGEGESSFSGSTPERLQNIVVATERFHGVVVPAQATFSFVAHLGAVTSAQGYSEGWVIYGNRTVLGPGGGVCQVSTTCFRAAFWGGFALVERSPHSYRVSWYEPPLGLDAAVFAPVTDMKFKNDTDAPLLILTEVDQAKSKVYFRFYSAPTGRKVTMEDPVIGPPVPAGDPVYEEDPTLAPGTRILAERAHDGIDATIYRTVEQDGVIISRDKVYSRYEPWPARYRVGPGTEVPARQ